MAQADTLNKNQLPIFIKFFLRPRNLVFWVVLIVVCYLFIDKPLAIYLQRFNGTGLRLFAHYATKLGAGWINLSVAVILLAISFISHTKKIKAFAFFLISALISTGVVCGVIKIVIGRARPFLFFHHDLYGFYFLKFSPHYWSLPSGHTTIISASMTALVLVWPRFEVLAMAAIVLVALCRLILEQHFLSDVLVGVMLGVEVTFFVFQQLITYTKLRENLLTS